MALEPDPHLQDIVDRLYTRFAPIFLDWAKGQTSNPAIPPTPEECLNADIALLGKSLASLDEHSNRLDINLLAEVLVLLKRSPSSLPYEVRVQQMDDRLRWTPDASVAPASVSSDGIPELLFFRVMNEWVGTSEDHKPAAKAAVDSLLDMVNVFVMRDGQLTSKEMAVFGVLEKRLRS